MKDMLQHKGFYGSVHFDEENLIFYGKVEFIRALVSYEASTAKTLKIVFVDAVEDYLQLCNERGITG